MSSFCIFFSFVSSGREKSSQSWNSRSRLLLLLSLDAHHRSAFSQLTQDPSTCFDGIQRGIQRLSSAIETRMALRLVYKSRSSRSSTPPSIFQTSRPQTRRFAPFSLIKPSNREHGYQLHTSPSPFSFILAPQNVRNILLIDRETERRMPPTFSSFVLAQRVAHPLLIVGEKTSALYGS